MLDAEREVTSHYLPSVGTVLDAASLIKNVGTGHQIHGSDGGRTVPNGWAFSLTQPQKTIACASPRNTGNSEEEREEPHSLDTSLGTDHVVL